MGILISSLVFMPPQNSIGEVYGELDKDKIIKLKTRLHNDRIPAYHLDKKVAARSPGWRSILWDCRALGFAASVSVSKRTTIRTN
jgi:hypothetical protein